MALHFAAAARSMLAGLALAGPPSMAQAETPDAFDEAMQAYSLQHFRRAFDGLARLADGGDANAARIALLMVRHGPRLFGERFDIAPQRRMRWLDLESATAPHSADHSSEPRKRPGSSVNSPATMQPPM